MGAAHALGYEHPEMGVGAGAVSPLLYHPLTLTFEAVGVGAGRVVIAPVGVYCGKRDGATGTFDIVVGGQGKEDVTLGGMSPAPAPPVCHGRYVPLNGPPGVTLSAVHFP